VATDRFVREASERLLLLGAVALYYAVFIWSYETFVAALQNSLGFSRHEIPAAYRMLNWLMVLTPALWLPTRLERPSMLLFLLQYIVVFIPATVVIYNSSLPVIEPSDACTVLVTLFIALSIWQSVYWLPLLKAQPRLMSARLFWSLFAIFSLALLGFVAGVLGHNFRITDLTGIYAVRFAAADITTGSLGGFVQHAQMWLAGAVLPLLFATAVLRRTRWLYAIIVAVYLFLFGVAGAKSALLGVPILAMIALWMRAGPARAPLRLVLGMTVLLLVPVLMSGDDERSQFLLKWYVFLVHTRIFTIQALAIGQYYAFFQDHPYTLWSHINGISMLVHYPYEIDVPRTIGEYYYNINFGDNAGFWASDGIAALGLPGTIVIGIVGAVLVWLFDALAARHDVRFAVVALGFIAISFTNISIATTLVSGGGLLLAAALYCMPAVSTKPRVYRPSLLTATTQAQ
jgi:hypothetical protein